MEEYLNNVEELYVGHTPRRNLSKAEESSKDKLDLNNLLF